MRRVLACAAAVLLAGLVYFNALHNPFVYDDHRTILDNGSIVDLHDYRSIALHDATRPLVNLTYAIDRHFWGLDPFGFHVTNVILHMLNVALLFGLARRVSADSRVHASSAGVAAFAAAVLFAVHPMMTEAVGYISGRSELLCAVFFLVAMHAAWRWMTRGGAGWWLLAAAAWVVALLTKETAVMWPFVALGADWLLLDGSSADRRGRVWRFHVPFVGITLIAAVARIAVFSSLEHPADLALDWRLILAELDVLRRYLGLLIVPAGQSIFHAVPPLAHVYDMLAVRGLATLGVLLAAGWWLRRRAPIVAFGIGWFLLLLAPSTALVALGQGEGMVEHRVYLASVGLLLAAGVGVARIAAWADALTPRMRWLCAGVFAAGVLSLSGRTVLRNATWSSPVTLWQEAVNDAPDEWYPHTVLGESLHDAGRHADAVAQYRTALLLRPGEELGYIKLSLCLSELGRADEAKAALEDLRRLDPGSTMATTGLGIVTLMAGDEDGARRYLRQTLDKAPGDVMALQWMAAIAEQMDGNAAEALGLCEQIQRIIPGDLGNDDCVRRNRARVAAGDTGPR